MSISSTGLYGSATIVNSDLFNDVETLKEQVTTLSTSYLDTTREHREDISQNRQDCSYCSRKCQKEGWYKYHKFTCKKLKNDGGFDRDTHNDIKCGINLNINRSCFKDSIVCTSGCKYWKVNFDPDDKEYEPYSIE